MAVHLDRVLLFCCVAFSVSADPAFSDPDSSDVRCSDPPEDRLQAMLRKEFFVFPGNTDSQFPYSVTRDAHSRQDKRCPSRFDLFRATSLPNRAICPWSYRFVTLDGWYPAEHVEAECMCQKCLAADNHELTCEKVYVLVNFLKRGHCVDGVYQYHNSYRKIAVACVCAVPRFLI